MKPRLLKMVSAHVMGGCGMASTEAQGVTRPDGVHWQLENLSIHDGSSVSDQHRRKSAAVGVWRGEPAGAKPGQKTDGP